jgi:hypothetical protein
MFVILRLFLLVTPFQPSVMFKGNTRSTPCRGTPESCITRVSSGLTRSHLTRLESPARDKHSNYFYKNFITLGPCLIQTLQSQRMI